MRCRFAVRHHENCHPTPDFSSAFQHREAKAQRLADQLFDDSGRVALDGMAKTLQGNKRQPSITPKKHPIGDDDFR